MRLTSFRFFVNGSPTVERSLSSGCTSPVAERTTGISAGSADFDPTCLTLADCLMTVDRGEATAALTVFLGCFEGLGPILLSCPSLPVCTETLLQLAGTLDQIS